MFGRYHKISDHAIDIANRALLEYSIFGLYNKVEAFEDGGRDIADSIEWAGPRGVGWSNVRRKKKIYVI